MTEQGQPADAWGDESADEQFDERADHEPSHDETSVDGPLDAEAVRTGVAEVDRVLSDVEGLGDRPLEDHLGVYERAHESLRSALDARPDQSA